MSVTFDSTLLTFDRTCWSWDGLDGCGVVEPPVVVGGTPRGGADLRKVLRQQRRIDRRQQEYERRQQENREALRSTIDYALLTPAERQELQAQAEAEAEAARQAEAAEAAAKTEAARLEEEAKQLARRRVKHNRDLFNQQLKSQIDKAFKTGKLQSYEGLDAPALLQMLRRLARR